MKAPLSEMKATEELAAYRWSSYPAKEYGYRDGSGVHRVVHRLEQSAKDDRDLAQRL